MTDTAGGAHAASNPHSGPVPTGDHPVTEGGLDVRAVNAMLRLAAAKGWRDPKLVDIAREAGISLSDLVTVATSKTDLLALWSSEIDREVLAEIEGEDLSREAAHDRLFDVLMLRFDVMARHKSALIALHEDLRRDPVAIAALVRPTQRSLALMLEAAGIAVVTGPGEADAQALYEAFFHRLEGSPEGFAHVGTEDQPDGDDARDESVDVDEDMITPNNQWI